MTDLDDTQPQATPVTPNALSSAAPPNPASPAATTDVPSGATVPVTPPPLPAAPPPDSPSTWREPPWVPPREPARRGPSPVAIVVGLIILAAGIYYFVDRTLGIDLPTIQWSNLWPILLVLVGALIIIRALGRDR
jgi:hypothetical protein